jgi:hypothetical protein
LLLVVLLLLCLLLFVADMPHSSTRYAWKPSRNAQPQAGCGQAETSIMNVVKFSCSLRAAR